MIPARLERAPLPLVDARPELPAIEEQAAAQPTFPQPSAAQSRLHPPLARRLEVCLRPQDFPVMPLLSPIGFPFAGGSAEVVHA